MYECFHCGCRAVIWQSDFPLIKWEGEGEGLVHFCICSNCGAEITYILRDEEEEDGEDS